MTKGHFSALAGAAATADVSNVRESMSTKEEEQKRVLSAEGQKTLATLADAATAELESLNAMYERAAKIDQDTDEKLAERIAVMEASIQRSDATLADPRIAKAIKDFSL